MTDLAAIDWSLLSKAMEFYQRRGFKRVELPWSVAKTSAELVLEALEKPARGLLFRQIKVPGDQVLTLSPEQGFVHRDILAGLSAEEGRFVACAPAMYVDHQGQVVGTMQVTLHQTDAVDEIALGALLDIAEEFARHHVPDPALVNHERSDDGWALMYGRYVIGTYGIRSAINMAWISGTGLCEPYFSTAIR